ncbi:DUF2341 domain-containing protein [Mucilaginibacter sp. L3T2-6]|uniref:DUF2341 domain-containing protein n=1 Tax=Mucilaginibacter sp. L3T2-6 TaxID=3062491 RepID=UPI00267754F7|nr:DUF2341 domain-containing protein [Mucilaginibacter sp. L3T2-6]MDO3642346.1 DUF2341 domain-containing protein [Mucilaginibacter sp. L3T2-6]MDV6214841.1 DUF2341 domain-containing protein [Mucilaginibacter sp. L3T2-6]
MALHGQPQLSYNPSSNIYTAGTAISDLSISNSGSSVSNFNYGSRTQLGGTISGPAGIGTDASGNIYVTNYDNNTISEYSSSGTFIGTFISGGALNGPVGIVFDSAGNAYVLNYSNGRILKYDSGGGFQSTIVTGMSSPTGITIDASGNIYVCDSDNDRVRKYSTSGSLLATINLNFNDEPRGVVLNSTGDIFILLYGSDKVVKYNSSLVFQSGFTGITGLNNSWALAIDGADNLYVGSSGENRLRIYNQSGTALKTITVTDAEGIAVGPTGTLYVSSYSGSTVYKYPPSGGYFINAELPAGLSFNSSTGQISGTPTTFAPTTTYTVYGYRNSSSFGSTTVTITVRPAAPVVSGAGTGCSVALTASGGSPAGGTYTWYDAASGGTTLATGTTYTASPGTYYVSYTYSGIESARSSGATVTAGSSPVLATAPTGGGLYLSYPFNGNANDASSANDDGTAQGGASLTTDRYNQANKAYNFNGSSQYIKTASASASPGPQSFSISVWFKTTTSSGGLLVGYGSSQTGASSMYDRHLYMANGGQIYYGIYPGSVQTISTSASYADGNWHHAVAVTSTTDGSFLYIDGALVTSDASMTTSQSYGVNGYWRIAYDNLDGWTNQPSSRYFNGSLDDIAIYKSALTASQVYSLYGAGSSPICAGNTLSLQANSVSGATYSWSGPNGFTSTSQNPTVTTNAATANAGTYTLTVTNSTGCTTTTTVTAVVNDAPSAAFTATSTVQIGSNATVTYSGTYASASTYTWDFNGGTIASGSGVGPYTINWSSAGTKTITLTVTNSTGCTATTTQTVTVSAANYGNYGFKKPITLNTTTLGIMSNLTNFPALLTIQDNNLIISNTCTDKVHTPNGPNYDFAFTDANGTSELYYQIESYDQTTGTLLVWVQIPTLTYAVNNSIMFYYGSTSPTVTHNTAFFQNTWASDYKAVYHFNEGTYSGAVTDGTSGGHTGTAGGMTSSDLVTGKIGTAYSFNGSSKKITANAVTITGPFTISAWVKPATVNNDQKILTNQATGGSSTGGYKLGIFSDGKAEAESATGINRGSSPPSPALSANTWYYVQGVFDGSSLSTYVNGSQYAVLSTTTAPSSTNPLYIGVGEGGNVYYFNGIIDEARVSGTAKSAEWLKAEYVNQNNPAAFTSAGATTVVSANAASLAGALTYTWKGTSTNAGDANNWDNTTAGIANQLPAFDGTATLVIPSGLSYYPVMSGDGSLYGLTIASGASINLNGYTLNVGCNIYNSSGGQILYGNSNTSVINWNGSLANQTYTGTNTSATAAMGAMTINNTSGGTVSISGGPVDIYDHLTIISGNLAVGSSPAALTLKSTATQTAYVSALPSGSSITGTVKVERYITGGTGYRGYRLISSPVYAATVNSVKVYDISYLINGMYLTGTTGTAGGFDKTGNPSLYLYREDQVPNNSGFTTGNFWGISKINNSPSYNYYMNGGSTTYNLPAGNGVMVFFRGNRAAASLAAETVSTYTAAPTVTLTSSGTLNQGQIVVRNWYTPTQTTIGYTGSGTASTTNYKARGFNLVGNPYASGIDWETFNTTSSSTGIYGVNIGNTIWEFNATTRSYSTYQKGGASSNGGIRTIGSGQGFFVQASAANPQLIFNESAKVSTQNTTTNYFETTRNALVNVGKTENEERSYLRLELSSDSVNHEDVYIGFDKQASRAYVFDEDAYYMKGSGRVNLSTLSADNIPLAINRIRLPLRADTIRLNVSMAAQGQYSFNMTEIKDMPDIYEIWLMDAYKKDSLDIKHNPVYKFDTFNGDTSSFSAHRFSLIIRQNQALALHLLNFKGAKTANGAEITWTVENEANYTYFTVERSNDNGATFKVAGGYSSTNEGTYSLLDRYPPIGTDIYRLKMEDVNGVVTYSKTISLVYTAGNKLPLAPISVYPNPARNTITVSIVPSIKQIPETINVSYSIIITGSNGNVVQKATSSQAEWQGAVSNLLPGSYVVQVLDNKNNAVVGQSKFIKL